MTTLTAASRDGAYSIHIGSGRLGQLFDVLGELSHNGSAFLVTDTNVWRAHGARVQAICKGRRLDPIILPPGERTKSWTQLSKLVDHLIKAGASRSSTIIAFGGGVVGDLTGFAASILHRGCRYIQVPTTLLSQVDSSVGGKTGINTKSGKNQVGSFHAPSSVLIDPDLLVTLPGQQIRAGYAEILKCALIRDPDLFEWLERNLLQCLVLCPETVCAAITKAVKCKIGIVSVDELEREGDRVLLNFGHTFGHAIEAETHFQVLHGEAVALGMTLAFQLSAELGHCDPADATRVLEHIKRAGLPTSLKSVGISGSAARLAKHFSVDKKIVGTSPLFIMTRGIGAAFADPTLTVGRVTQFLDQL